MKIDFQAAIFDLDGTITDSMGAWEYACGELCKSEKIIPHTDLKTDLKSLNLPEIAEYFVKNYNLLDSVENIYKKLGYLKKDDSSKLKGNELLDMLMTDYVIWDNFGLKKEEYAKGLYS